MRKWVLWAGLILVLGVVNFMIIGKERTLADGEVMLLDLAPKDPRSLMQGDYMTLRYSLAREVARDLGEGSAGGRLVVRLDADRVAHYQRLYEDNTPLQADERLLYFRKRGSGVRLAGDAFFFQEGHGRYYSRARFGELRVDADGRAILVGLRDREHDPLGPPRENGSDG